MRLCEYPNCHMEAVQRVNNKNFCGEHGDGYREFLSETIPYPEWCEREGNDQ